MEAPPVSPRVSVVTTVLNERKGIRDLLDSLVAQVPAHEVVVVDAGSTDGTWEILEDYATRFPQVRPFRVPGRRGAGRNAGVAYARSELVAFIDGDCIANAFWLEGILEAFDAGADIVAGDTRYMGYWAFANMQRVELEHKGKDVTWPSCNLAYRREVFLKVGGFDERFITAEDVDLNFRAIDAGHDLRHTKRALVYARARDSIKGFMRQAYWNGYGRKQLTLKHGRLWGEYSLGRMLARQSTFWGLVRIGMAFLGYVHCKLKERRIEYRGPDGVPQTVNAALGATKADAGRS
ncbi:MAG: glycosyltransferase [Euryarchaeota archaeon]|nr:glycosyltransferase [Euryarchaeota archaeon]